MDISLPKYYSRTHARTHGPLKPRRRRIFLYYRTEGWLVVVIFQCDPQKNSHALLTDSQSFFSSFHGRTKDLEKKRCKQFERARLCQTARARQNVTPAWLGWLEAHERARVTGACATHVAAAAALMRCSWLLPLAKKQVWLAVPVSVHGKVWLLLKVSLDSFSRHAFEAR